MIVKCGEEIDISKKSIRIFLDADIPAILKEKIMKGFDRSDIYILDSCMYEGLSPTERHRWYNKALAFSEIIALWIPAEHRVGWRFVQIMQRIESKGKDSVLVGLDRDHPSRDTVKEIFLLSEITTTASQKTFMRSLKDMVLTAQMENRNRLDEDYKYA